MTQPIPPPTNHRFDFPVGGEDPADFPELPSSELRPNDLQSPNFNYLLANPDVAVAVLSGQMPSGLYHYRNYGRDEGRPFPPTSEDIDKARQQHPEVLTAVWQAFSGSSVRDPQLRALRLIGTAGDGGAISPVTSNTTLVATASPAPEGPYPPAHASTESMTRAGLVASTDAPPVVQDDTARNAQAHSAAASHVHHDDAGISLPPEATEESPASGQQFDENRYLEENPDVAAAVRNSDIESGAHHYHRHGYAEGRNGYVG